MGYSTSSQSLGIEVKGDNFAGKPSDAHVVCHVPWVLGDVTISTDRWDAQAETPLTMRNSHGNTASRRPILAIRETLSGHARLLRPTSNAVTNTPTGPTDQADT